MLKKVALGAAVLLVVAGLGLFVWARSVLGQDGVRVALAGQIAKALGQPVTVGSVGASIYPRVTVTLGDVAIGEPARIHVRKLDVGTAFGALLSRRIEHASLHLNGARIELPLPPLSIASGSSGGAKASDSTSPVQLVSIDEVVLSDVQIVSGGRTLIGNVDVVPQGNGVTIRNVTLKAEDTSITATGAITDLTGPAGELTIKAGALNLDRLLAFANEFTAGAGLTSGAAPTPSAKPTAPSTMNLTMSLEAERATMGALNIENLVGRAIMKGSEVSLQPLAFGLFGGRYQGTITATLGDTPTFHWKAGISGLDVNAAATFAGSPDTISGKLTATVDLIGSGADATTAIKTARGTARVDIADGVINNLGLVRAVTAATSLNAGAVRQAAAGPRSEPFSHLGGTLTVANGSASTQDLRLDSKDLRVTAAGALRLDGSAVNMQGQVQLSQELSTQAGSAVVRATQQNGRITLPVTVGGVAGNYAVKVDAASMAKRAIMNEANDQAQQAIKRGLGGFLKK